MGFSTRRISTRVNACASRKLTKAGYGGLIGNIASLLEQGAKLGDFRSGVDPVELYISISALAYHYLSNRYTLSYLLDRKLLHTRMR